jgi:metallo-beta-lactamase family protein
MKTVDHTETYDYYQTFSPKENIFITFKNSGHILGSSLIEVVVNENNKSHKIVFTGDIGNTLTTIIQPTDFIDGCDTLVVESTYGNKLHKGMDRRKLDLLSAIDKTVKNGGSVLIPAFSIERTEEILYDLNDLINQNKIHDIPVYLDSPLSKNILNVYKKYKNLFNDVALKKINSGDDIFNFPNFNVIDDSIESLKVINDKHPKIILAGSGMLSGGRIINYLPIYLTQKNNTIVFISYQAKNTIGEKLIQNHKTVFVEGRKVRVKCNIAQISAYSSHADKRKLDSFVKNIKHPVPKTIFINHGDVDQASGFKQNLSQTSKSKLIITEPNKKYLI